MGFEQIGIMVFGWTAVLLSQRASLPLRKWACICGLCSQPFYFYATWHAEQWGMFSAAFAYTFAWGSGLWTYWRSAAETDTGA